MILLIVPFTYTSNKGIIMNGFIVLLVIAIVCFVVVVFATVKKNDALNDLCIMALGCSVLGVVIGEALWKL